MLSGPTASGAGSVGQLVLFLHAHLPYVRHPDDENFFEEDWLYDALTDTYLPLLAVAEGWLQDQIPARLTVSLSPTLLEMLRDQVLIDRYIHRLRLLIDVTESEVARHSRDKDILPLAEMYRDRLVRTLDSFTKYDRDVVGAFKTLADAGILELVTTCGTHAFLPAFDPDFARAQIRLGVQAYRTHVGGIPRGMWLPECGFVPGIDSLLAAEGVEYFLIDSHGIQLADPTPVFDTFSPVVCPSGVVAFARDPDSSVQVWSGEWGYPADPRYREFYRDIGHEANTRAMNRLRLSDGTTRSVGIKYHRITDRSVPLEFKMPYDRAVALRAAAEHAGHFLRSRETQCVEWRQAVGRSPVITTPYDAELFGHWWFEGTEFLDFVVRGARDFASAFRLSSPGDVLESDLEWQVAMPAASSWGAGGFSDTWLNDSNDWIWPHLHHVVAELETVAHDRVLPGSLEERALNQLAREAVLAASSDWPFIMAAGTVVEYATRRVRLHVSRFNALLAQYRKRVIDEPWLLTVEREDSIFPDIDYRGFASTVGSRARAQAHSV